MSSPELPETDGAETTTTTYGYDVNGNRATKQVGTAAPTTYTWDVSDRLVSADTDADGDADFESVYDYRTRRVVKRERDSETGVMTGTYFRYDGGVSFEELDEASGEQNVVFVRGSGMGGGIGSILYSIRVPENNKEEYFIFNAVGHTVALTDEYGEVSKSNLYEAFGNIVGETGTSSNNRLANTKERDASLNLDNHGFRYYDPEIGRYISRDPIGYGDGMNVYNYGNSNPVNFIDPLGLDGEKVGKQASDHIKKHMGEMRKTHGDDEAFQNFDKRYGIATGQMEEAIWMEATTQKQRAEGIMPEGAAIDKAIEKLAGIQQEKREAAASPDRATIENHKREVLTAYAYGAVAISMAIGGWQAMAANGIVRGGISFAAEEAFSEYTGIPVSPRDIGDIFKKGWKRLFSDSADFAPSSGNLGKGGGGGRGGKQFRGPDPEATGPHTRFRTDPETGKVTHYETYDHPVEGAGKRFDGVGPPHGDVPTPHVHPTTRHVNPNNPSQSRYTEGPPRPPTPDELPSGY